MGHRINISVIFAFLVIGSSLYLFSNQTLHYVGTLLLYSIILLAFFTYVYSAIGQNTLFNQQLICLITIGIYLIIELIINHHEYSFSAALVFLISLLFANAMMECRLEEDEIIPLLRLFKLVFYTFFIAGLLFYLTGHSENFRTIVSPTVFKLLFPCSIAVLSFEKDRYYKIAPFVAGFFLLGERTSSICMCLALLLFIVLKRIKRYSIKVFLFWAVIILSIALPVVYVWFSYQPSGRTLNQLVFTYTGENFFSGRQRLWALALNAIVSSKRTFWVGLGFGNELFIDNNVTLSTHNVYVFLVLNGGILLLLFFVLYLRTIWGRLLSISHNQYSTQIQAYFLTLLVFIDFELFLVANNMVVSLVWWLTLSIPVMLSESKGTRFLLKY